jgi:hypothetical protein
VNAQTPSRPAVTLLPGGDAALWTEQRIRALGAVTDLPTAGRIFGLGRSLAYQLAKADQFPAPVIRVGARYRVPVAGILAALAIPTTDDLTPASKGSVDHPYAIRSTDQPPTEPARRQGEP